MQAAPQEIGEFWTSRAHFVGFSVRLWPSVATPRRWPFTARALAQSSWSFSTWHLAPEVCFRVPSANLADCRRRTSGCPCSRQSRQPKLLAAWSRVLSAKPACRKLRPSTSQSPHTLAPGVPLWMGSPSQSSRWSFWRRELSTTPASCWARRPTTATSSSSEATPRMDWTSPMIMPMAICVVFRFQTTRSPCSSLWARNICRKRLVSTLQTRRMESRMCTNWGTSVLTRAIAASESGLHC
mmetsp:Transcript_23739/g.51862  ORF Transcript_23739/g.51862 Transcript_23739/m.51862 type:complete len:240 (+) Transcript_23739:619-1338(+)